MSVHEFSGEVEKSRMMIDVAAVAAHVGVS